MLDEVVILNVKPIISIYLTKSSLCYTVSLWIRKLNYSLVSTITLCLSLSLSNLSCDECEWIGIASSLVIPRGHHCHIELGPFPLGDFRKIKNKNLSFSPISCACWPVSFLDICWELVNSSIMRKLIIRLTFRLGNWLCWGCSNGEWLVFGVYAAIIFDILL